MIKKKTLRHTVLEQRRLFSMVSGDEASARICEILRNHFSFDESQVIAGYAPINFEANILPFLAEQKNTCLPITTQEKAPLTFRRYTAKTVLEKGFWNIPVPPVSAEDLVPDILLVPMIGFDKDCNRLGYGGGYYDRTLHKLRAEKNVTAIGIVFEMQKLDTIEIFSHDQEMDFIVTEKGLIKR
ncbi:MAG: 5-formyltetrahydrofolate cyclo-ligase [Alphaproteobacteria bacterium]